MMQNHIFTKEEIITAIRVYTYKEYTFGFVIIATHILISILSFIVGFGPDIFNRIDRPCLVNKYGIYVNDTEDFLMPGLDLILMACILFFLKRKTDQYENNEELFTYKFSYLLLFLRYDEPTVILNMLGSNLDLDKKISANYHITLRELLEISGAKLTLSCFELKSNASHPLIKYSREKNNYLHRLPDVILLEIMEFSFDYYKYIRDAHSNSNFGIYHWLTHNIRKPSDFDLDMLANFLKQKKFTKKFKLEFLDQCNQASSTSYLPLFISKFITRHLISAPQSQQSLPVLQI